MLSRTEPLEYPWVWSDPRWPWATVEQVKNDAMDCRMTKEAWDAYCQEVVNALEKARRDMYRSEEGRLRLWAEQEKIEEEEKKLDKKTKKKGKEVQQ